MDAQLSVRLPSGYTGEMLTEDDEYTMLVPGSVKPPSTDRDVHIETTYDDVPPGGDAAFAAAVCPLKNGWAFAIPRLSSVDVTDPQTAQIVASTPHYLRALGRTWCGELKGSDSRVSSAPVNVEELELRAEEYKRDPQAWKQQVVNQYEVGMFGVSDLADPQTQQKFTEHQAERLARLKGRSATELVDAYAQYVELLRAANDHLCPQYG